MRSVNELGADQSMPLVASLARDPSNGRRSPCHRSARKGAETAGSFTPNDAGALRTRTTPSGISLGRWSEARIKPLFSKAVCLPSSLMGRLGFSSPMPDGGAAFVAVPVSLTLTSEPSPDAGLPAPIGAQRRPDPLGQLTQAEVGRSMSGELPDWYWDHR
jgi:hypothetical protein